MKGNGRIRRRFKLLWKYYVLQSLLATGAVSVLLAALGKDRMVLFSAIGATCFIVFAMPRSEAAQTRNVIGGHLIALVTAGLFRVTAFPYFVEYPLVVGLSILVMVVLKAEHPPATGTALAGVINEVSADVILTVLVSVLVLSQCRYYMRRYLKDLI